MSIPQKVNVTCPKCKTSFEATIWNSVNTGLSADLPQKIISGEFFDAVCPKCGFTFQLEYGVLYNDMRHHMMVWVVHKGENYEKRVEEIRSTIVISGSTTRIVNSVARLREKVAILESGRDDRVVEIMKYMLFEQAKKEIPSIRIENAYYIYSNGKEYVVFYEDNNTESALVFDSNVYHNVQQMFEAFLRERPSIPYEVVDYEWAFKTVEQHCEATEKEAVAENLPVEDLLERYKSESKNEEKQQIESFGIQAEQEKIVQSETEVKNPCAKYCRKCGEKLVEDSIFCHNCGERVILPDIETKNPSYQHAARPEDLPKAKKKFYFSKRLIGSILGVLLIAIVLALLSSESFKNVFFSTVSIDGASEFNMTIGVARKLTCTTNPNEISDDVTWDSSNPSVAVVRHNGVVVAKSEGTATITVAIDGVVKDSCTVHVSAKPVSVNNGQMIISPKNTGYPEVTINAPKGKNCFVYFDNVYNSSNDFAFYVVAGSSATVNVPSGTYDFYYATGDIWYGKEQKFGKDTNYYRSPDVITLSEDSTSYDSIELTLYTVPNGNMDTDPVDENMFPI